MCCVFIVLPLLGCAFVTYCLKESAVNAQQNLHEKRTLPAVRERDSENEGREAL